MNNPNKENTPDFKAAHGDSGVKFQGDWRPPLYEPKPPKMIQLVMKYSGGLVKNEKQASYVLMGFVAVAMIITLFLIFGGGGGPKPPFEGGSNPQAPFE